MNNESAQSEAPMGIDQMEPETGRETSLDAAHAQLAKEANEAADTMGAVKEQGSVASQPVGVSPFNEAFVQSFIDRCCKAVSKNRCAELEKIVSRIVPPEQAALLASKAAMEEGTRETIVESGTEVARKWGLGNLFSPEVMLISAIGLDWLHWTDAKGEMEAIIAKYAPKPAPAPKTPAPAEPENKNTNENQAKN